MERPPSPSAAARARRPLRPHRLPARPIAAARAPTSSRSPTSATSTHRGRGSIACSAPRRSGVESRRPAAPVAGPGRRPARRAARGAARSAGRRAACIAAGRATRSASALAWEPHVALRRRARSDLAALAVVVVAVFGDCGIECAGGTALSSPTRRTIRSAPNGDKRSRAEISALHGSRRDAVGARGARTDQGRRGPRHVRDMPRRARRRAAVADAGVAGAAAAGCQRRRMGTLQRARWTRRCATRSTATLAESDKQAAAAYMREVVMPGMARLLHRPAYDFTRSVRSTTARGSRSAAITVTGSGRERWIWRIW